MAKRRAKKPGRARIAKRGGMKPQRRAVTSRGSVRGADAQAGGMWAGDLARIGTARELFWYNVMRELLTSLSVLSARREGGEVAEGAEGGAKPGPVGGGDVAAGSPISSSITNILAAPGVSAGSLPVASSDPPDGDDEGDGDTSEEDGSEEGEELDASLAVAGEAEASTHTEIGKRPGDIFDGRLAVITSLGQRIPIGAVHPVFACGVRDDAGPNLLSTIIECTVFEITTPGGEVFTLPVHEIRAFHALTPELVEEIGRAARKGTKDETDSAPFGFAAFTSLSRAGGRLRDIPVVMPDSIGE